jgi:hypothetical protein
MEINTQMILWLVSPSLVVVAVVITLVKWFLNQETERRRQEFLMQNSQSLLNYKLQAYERFSLLLERITPEALVLREQKPKMTAFQLQSKLLETVRTEFNHNLAMQIYVPLESWEQIKRAREEVVRLINTTASQVPPNVPAFELGRRIIEEAGGLTSQMLKKAMQGLNKDLEKIGLR